MKDSGKKQKIKANMVKAPTMDGSVASANGGVKPALPENREPIGFNV